MNPNNSEQLATMDSGTSLLRIKLRKRVPLQIREHLLNDWAKFVPPIKLSDKLDEYDRHQASWMHIQEAWCKSIKG